MYFDGNGDGNEDVRLVATYYNIYLIFISNFLPWQEAYEIATRPGQQRPWPWPEGD